MSLKLLSRAGGLARQNTPDHRMAASEPPSPKFLFLNVVSKAEMLKNDV